MNFVSRFKKRIVTLVQALFWSILSLLQFNTCLKIKSQITAGCSHLLRNKFQHVKSFQKMLFPFYFLFIDFALLRYRLQFETFLLLKKKLYVASHSILLWIVNQWNGVSEFYVFRITIEWNYAVLSLSTRKAIISGLWLHWGSSWRCTWENKWRKKTRKPNNMVNNENYYYYYQFCLIIGLFVSKWYSRIFTVISMSYFPESCFSIWKIWGIWIKFLGYFKWVETNFCLL